MSPHRETVLLMSGGLDSACLAYLYRPSHLLFVDYGQRTRTAENRAARAVAQSLGLNFSAVEVGLTDVGGGLLHDGKVLGEAPSPEWWPFRNQFLITIAAAWGCINTGALASPGEVKIMLGTVKGDGDRHADGGAQFMLAAEALLQTQEGAFRISTPAIDWEAESLLHRSEAPDSVIAWTHSCHVSDLPCGECPGCYKRSRVLASAGRLQ